MDVRFDLKVRDPSEEVSTGAISFSKRILAPDSDPANEMMAEPESLGKTRTALNGSDVAKAAVEKSVIAKGLAKVKEFMFTSPSGR